MNKFSEIRDLVMSLEKDFDAFYNKNSSIAGTRARKGLQELKNLSQTLRLEIQDIKNKKAEEAKK